MFSFIKGSLVNSVGAYAVVETAGIGYKIYVPVSVGSKLPQQGQQVLLYLSYVVRDMSQSLYGFLTEQDRDLFEMLMSINGVGPKLALNIIGHLALSQLHEAIIKEEVTSICKVPGIGKKTAERLIVELKDKLPKSFSNERSSAILSFPKDPHSQKIRDAASALMNLGYNQSTVQKAIKKTLQDNGEEIELASLITNALKNV